MKKAFTLIELLISIILLSIIVTLLYQSITHLQTSNEQILNKVNSIDKRESVLTLLYNDFINLDHLNISHDDENIDTIVLQGNNTLHNISHPFIYYKVSKKKQVLRRIESPFSKSQDSGNVLRFNDILNGITMFKVYENNGHVFVYLQAENMEDIYLDIIPPVFAFNTHNDNTNVKNNGTPNEQE